jgi:chromosome segregation ATPase
METLIFISAAIAIGVLFVILWSTDRELREKNRRLQIAEARLTTHGVEGGAAVSTASATESEKITDLENRLNALADERTQLLGEVENLREKLQRHEANRNLVEVEDGPTHVTNENAELRARIQALEGELDGREEHVALLKDEQAKTSEMERQISELRERHGQFLSQIEKLEREKQANLGLIRELEESHSKVSTLERSIAQLRGENAQLSGELVNFKQSLQDKIQSQINALQELCSGIDSGKE